MMSAPSNLDLLYRAHIKNPQFRASDFLKLSSFPYAKETTESNLNIPSFAYGSLKHLLALFDGTLPPPSNLEFKNKLQHIIKVFEIVCLKSNLNDYTDSNWHNALGYNNQLLGD